MIGYWAWMHLRRDLVAMLTGNVPAYSVVASEGPRAVGTRDSDALVPLTDVSAQVGLVAVESFAVGTFELFSCKRNYVDFSVFRIVLFVSMQEFKQIFIALSLTLRDQSRCRIKE